MIQNSPILGQRCADTRRADRFRMACTLTRRKEQMSLLGHKSPGCFQLRRDGSGDSLQSGHRLKVAEASQRVPGLAALNMAKSSLHAQLGSAWPKRISSVPGARPSGSPCRPWQGQGGHHVSLRHLPSQWLWALGTTFHAGCFCPVSGEGCL